MVRGTRLQNDSLKVRLPIKTQLFEVIIFELQHYYADNPQPYLETMYKSLFTLAYYGLMRVGELAQGEHTLKARDVHIGQNKNKILLVLHSSKMHGKESRPQNIKITAVHCPQGNTNRFFCLFELTRSFLRLRGSYLDPEEPFFIFSDKSPVPAHCVQTTLRQILIRINLDLLLYDTHSFRIGRAPHIYSKWDTQLNKSSRQEGGNQT